MKKERVIVFDGEDKFIAPRKRTYDAVKGISRSNDELSQEAERFKAFMRNQNMVAVIPSPTDENFCKNLASFINTNGGGRATPEQIMEAHSMFQNLCIEKPKSKEFSQTGEGNPPEKPTEVLSDAPRPTTPDPNPKPPINSGGGGSGGGGTQPTPEPAPTPRINFPNWESLDCALLANKLANVERAAANPDLPQDITIQYQAALIAGRSVQESKCSQPTTTEPPSGGGGGTTTTITTNLPTVPLVVPNLGQPPMRGGFGGGGGGEEEVKAPEKKKTNWLLWILLAGGAIYLLTKKGKK